MTSPAGLNPSLWFTWAHLSATDEQITRFAAAGLTAQDVARTYAHTTASNGTPVAVTGEDLCDYVRADVTPALAAAYIDAGISRARDIADLHTWGCTPDVVHGWLTAAQMIGQGDVHLFYEWYRSTLQNLEEGPGIGLVPILNALMTHGDLPVPRGLADWQATGLSADRIGLLVAAGITPAEATSSDIAGADDDTLRALAALHRGIPTR